MKPGQIFKKPIKQIFFKLSLVIAFVLIAGFDPPSQPAVWGTLEIVLGFCFSIGLAALVTQEIRNVSKKDRVSAYLIASLLLAICFISLLYEMFPKLLNEFFTLGLLASFFFVAFLIIKLIVKEFLKPESLSSLLKIVGGIVFLVPIIIFGRHYYSLQERIVRLEEIAGPKKLVCDEREMIKEVKKSVVRIVGTWSEGTGFFVNESGLIATNHHVIAYDPNPKIVLPDYSMVQGKVIMADSQADIALIKASGEKSWPTVSFANSNQIEPMEELISIGYPLGTDLKGEATAIKGRFVAIRENSQMGVNFVQTDISLNPGASGGPMINLCGDVVAINTAGLAGLGMGITADDFQEKWWELLVSKEPLKDVEKIDFNPDNSPKECVEAFYNYQTVGNLKKAYGLLSKNYTDWPFEEWKEGYKNTLNIIIYVVEEDEEDENTVFVKFSSADLVDEDIVYHFFEGTVKVVEINGHLKLNDAEIKEIKDPEWDWFYTEE